jgi:hypothetical protein
MISNYNQNHTMVGTYRAVQRHLVTWHSVFPGRIQNLFGIRRFPFTQPGNRHSTCSEHVAERTPEPHYTVAADY